LLDEPDQLAVIRGLRDGRRDAWLALYDGYSADVWRYVSRLLGGQAADVGDVVQEVFLAAARGARSFDETRGSLWSWLAGIAHHQVAAHRRKSGQAERLRQRIVSDANDLRKWSETTESTLDIFERRELASLVRDVLAELSAEYAAMLTAKYLDEQSLEAMTARFGGSVEAIKSKLARARREFRDTLESRTACSDPIHRVRDAAT
jgi:RNA polymerase sigma-70 factor (ECF subfamily)